MLAVGLHYLSSACLSILHKTVLDTYDVICKALMHVNTSSFKLLPFLFACWEPHRSYLPLRDLIYSKYLYALYWCPRQFRRAKVGHEHLAVVC